MDGPGGMTVIMLELYKNAGRNICGSWSMQARMPALHTGGPDGRSMGPFHGARTSMSACFFLMQARCLRSMPAVHRRSMEGERMRTVQEKDSFMRLLIYDVNADFLKIHGSEMSGYFTIPSREANHDMMKHDPVSDAGRPGFKSSLPFTGRCSGHHHNPGRWERF